MGLSWQQGPLSSGAIGRFLVPEPLPKRLVYAKPLRRRMRVRFDGTWIAESEGVLLYACNSACTRIIIRVCALLIFASATQSAAPSFAGDWPRMRPGESSCFLDRGKWARARFFWSWRVVVATRLAASEPVN